MFCLLFCINSLLGDSNLHVKLLIDPTDRLKILQFSYICSQLTLIAQLKHIYFDLIRNFAIKKLFSSDIQ